MLRTYTNNVLIRRRKRLKIANRLNMTAINQVESLSLENDVPHNLRRICDPKIRPLVEAVELVPSGLIEGLIASPILSQQADDRILLKV